MEPFCLLGFCEEMLEAGMQFGRSRWEDRFYNPAKARTNRQNQKSQDSLRRAQGNGTAVSQSSSVTVKSVVSPVVSPLCNLERFLESITPAVPAQHLSKTTMRGWRTCDRELQSYFVLDGAKDKAQAADTYGGTCTAAGCGAACGG
ncbi:uncharacterized protein LOC130768860 [Actinidia eriantha]|uniref:uncharacterized protein LOC130768860 n=1 Tax=Actinidia eriantha TaxID=165200 RepID=UPI00258E418B|nr:uncharacterized protein LOC130768860 [Actinidia eriantha]